MSLQTQIGFQTVTTSNATLGAAVPTGMTVRLTSVTIQQPAAGVAKVISLAIGTTATPANIIRTYTIAAGALNFVEYPNIVLTAGQQLNVVTSLGTTEAVITASGLKDLATA